MKITLLLVMMDIKTMNLLKFLILKEIKEINISNDETCFVDIYYDKELFKNYIIAGNEGYIKPYDYTNNKIYHKYFDKK